MPQANQEIIKETITEIFRIYTDLDPKSLQAQFITLYSLAGGDKVLIDRLVRVSHDLLSRKLVHNPPIYDSSYILDYFKE